MTENINSTVQILIVEDSVHLAMIWKQIVESLEYTPLGPVPSIAKALEILAEEKPDVVLLDVSLSDGKCYPVADECRKQGIPFIFATAYDDPLYIKEEYREEPRLVKPFTQDDLAKAINNALQ
jgi:CheY-like chemotaxis protein